MQWFYADRRESDDQTHIPRSRIGAAQKIAIPIHVEPPGISLILRSHLFVIVTAGVACETILLCRRDSLFSQGVGEITFDCDSACVSVGIGSVD